MENHRKPVATFMLTRKFRLRLAAVLLLCWALPCYAHAILLSATPAVNQVIKGPDIEVKLRFNSRIDVKRCRLLLLAPDGKLRSLAIDDSSGADTLISHATGLAKGSHMLRWQVLASDGHISRGEVPFRVE